MQSSITLKELSKIQTYNRRLPYAIQAQDFETAEKYLACIRVLTRSLIANNKEQFEGLGNFNMMVFSNTSGKDVVVPFKTYFEHANFIEELEQLLI